MSQVSKARLTWCNYYNTDGKIIWQQKNYFMKVISSGKPDNHNNAEGNTIWKTKFEDEFYESGKPDMRTCRNGRRRSGEKI